MASALALTLMSTALPAWAQDNSARWDKIARSYADNHEFMGSVLVARDGQILFDRHYGYANLEWSIPDGPDTKYRIASVTKQFTAASILLLQERGKLKVTDTLKTYIPDVPAAWDNITIYNLLTHTSGIPDIPSLPDFSDYQLRGATFEQAVARFKERPLDFQPGEKMSYSNAGYIVLGYLIEKLSGQSYGDFVQQNIFIPLGMKDSGYDTPTAIISHRASGYVPTSDGIKNAAYINMSIVGSAGGLYSTTHDLLLWEQGLFGGKLLKPDSLKAMTTLFKGDYAFGVYSKPSEGHPMVAHAGGINGFNSELNYYPDVKLTVVVLGNVNSRASVEIATQIASIALGNQSTQPGERTEVKVDPALLADYAGTYVVSDQVRFTITVENGRLMMQQTGQGKTQLFAEADTKFFLKTENSTVEFSRGGDGKVAYLTLYRGRNRTPFKGVKQ
jgi:CubicO group peptidase (beta-lactamase class C family)